jgi:membrane-bound metal-dependent hydrolase YbcI (DUF457 family)
MNKLGHLIFGIIFFLIIYILLSEIYSIDNYLFLEYLGITAIYSLLPDIDKNNSWIRKKLDYILLFFTIIFGVLYYLEYISIYAFLFTLGIEIILTVIKHRGFIHSLLFGVLISAPWLFLGPIFFLAAITGFISHLVADKII